MIFFDDALHAAVSWVQAHRESLGTEATLLRDLAGRIRLMLPPDALSLAPELSRELHEALGAYSPGRPWVVAQADQDEWSELRNARVRLAPSSAEQTIQIFLVERLATEQLWEAAAVQRSEQAPPRITFFGLKGGVGRSTALVATAQYFARKGRKVLVVDLDLESPGVTSFLLPLRALPGHGIADWLIEESVGQQGSVVSEMYTTSPLGDLPGTQGEIWVAPALGRSSLPSPDPTDQLEELLRDGSYVAKLGRLYASLSGRDLAQRLDAMLNDLEARLSPDVVLLDSRAGLHELSAATIPRLGSTVLLFASASEQTWLGYRLLFSCWQRDKRVSSPFREQLRVVAAMIPETERKRYLDLLTQRSYDVFSSFLYEQEDSPGSACFNHQLTDDQAPHFPLPIYWRRELMGWDPKDPDSLTSEQFDAAFKPFLSVLEGLLPLSQLE